MIALVGMLAVLMVGDPPVGTQGKPPPADPDRPAISTSEIKALRDNNIFAPRSVTLHGPRTPKSSSGGSRSEPVYSKPKPPVVTGIFLDPKSKAYELIVEDRNESSLKQFKEPKLLKNGDEWSGLKVESVEHDHAVCRYGGASRNLRVGESLPEGVWKSGAAAASGEEDFSEEEGASAPTKSSEAPSRKTEAAPQSSEERGRVLEEMKKRNGKKNRPQEPEE